ncbi:hypothetical protein WOLCODRAFT_18273 [Wolfiporia cocos MD-104 SS10]|uniref:Uncharacterized protein n=1 Tax=Wolfiporia cocos (strain MD-104) TaxID=742152 RepID=A0A2H3JP66_WOLCO|nr:hypothetical protein WOLCODRAFT_18273 [Wolfiporia cocos MD-104 SS10]
MSSALNSSGAMSSRGAPALQAYRKSFSSINVSNEKNASSEAHRDGWSSEIRNKINKYQGTIERFLEEIVPSDEPYTPARRLGNPFGALDDGLITCKTDMYDPLVEGLNKLGSRFDTARRVTFYNSSLKDSKDPYSHWV